MNHKEEAIKRVEEMKDIIHITQDSEITNLAKQCALISFTNEYNALREQLFNLRSCGVIESEKTYLFRLQELIDQEKELKKEIELL